MSPYVPALGERLVAEQTLKWLTAIMSPKVIPEVTRLFEYLFTLWVYTLKVLFVSQRLGIIYFNNSMPLLRNPFKMLLGSFFALELDPVLH